VKRVEYNRKRKERIGGA